MASVTLRVVFFAVLIALCSGQSSPPPSSPPPSSPPPSGASSPPPSSPPPSGASSPPPSSPPPSGASSSPPPTGSSSPPPPSCSNLSISHDDYSGDSEPLPPAPSGSVITQAGPLSSAASIICPQLGGQPQCCADSFFADSRMKLFSDLTSGIGKQVRPQIGNFHSLVMEVNNYFTNIFPSEIANNFANNTPPPLISPNSSPRTDTFNISAVIHQLLSGLVDAVKKGSLVQDRICIDQQAIAVISTSGQAIASIARDLALVRNVSTVFNFVDRFALNATLHTISMVPPSNQCLNALLRLTCSKCQKTIPLLCRNVCGAVVRGCYAPYAAALNPQFNILWNVSNQLAQSLVNALSDLFTQQSNIRQALFSAVQTGCKIQIPSNVTAVPPQGLGNQFMKKVQVLLNAGLLSYDPIDGPLACNSSTQTAQSKCWNGTVQVSSDIPQFQTNSIKGQAQNPVFPFNEAQLSQQAYSIGTPVNDLLSSPDVTVAISGAAISIPQGQTYPTGSTSTNSAVNYAASLSVIFLLATITFLLSL